jgi:hypothetical protein
MWSFGPKRQWDPHNDARRHPRYPTEHFHCVIGEVRDLSAKGLRVVGPPNRKLAVGHEFKLVLRSRTWSFPVWVKVKRTRRLGLRQTEYGLLIKRIAPELTGSMGELAYRGRPRVLEEAGRSKHSDAPPVAPTLDGPVHQALSMLELGAEATPDQVRLAYRRLARIHHPDQPTGSEQRFARITDAYHLLKQLGRSA